LNSPYNILGINPVHNGSVALISDGTLIYYLEEERLSKLKKDSNPFKVLINILQKYPINEIVIGGTNNKDEHHKLPWTSESFYEAISRKYSTQPVITYMGHSHHLLHAIHAFINSGFSSSSILVIDGAGSKQIINNLDHWECESIFEFSFNQKFKEVYKRYIVKDSYYTYQDNHIVVDNAPGISKVYEAITAYLGFHSLEGGKTMGLAPYGKKNPNIPPLFVNGKGNKNLFLNNPPNICSLNTNNYPYLHLESDPKEWHNNFLKITNIEKDLARAVQNETQEEVIKLIQKSIELTNNKNICIVGGYGLNCTTNYYLKKYFPNLNIYNEPLSHDGGTSIGAAYFRWLEINDKHKIQPQSSLYLGPQYITSQLLKTISNAL